MTTPNLSHPDTIVPAVVPAAEKEDPFRYGWRFVKKSRPDGSEYLDQVPLTLEDVLHPQEEDVIPENTEHQPERDHLSGAGRSRLDRLRNGVVLSDCIIDWD